MQTNNPDGGNVCIRARLKGSILGALASVGLLALLSSCARQPPISEQMAAFDEQRARELAEEDMRDHPDFYQRRETCNSDHVKPGASLKTVLKLCPGAPSEHVDSADVSGRGLMLVYLPGPTYVHLRNEVVTSVQTLHDSQ